jgi:alcohol dehydrogenase class IV
VRRVLVVTDPGVAATGCPQRVVDHVGQFDIDAQIFDAVHVEPSLQQTVDYAVASSPWGGFVAVGGGSSIDAAKAITLMTTNPGEWMDCINPPVGGGDPR